jgi:chromosome partitioning protein
MTNRPTRTSNAAGPEETISRMVDDVNERTRPSAHIIVFANEKGGVGKSTLAFHCSVALANAGARVVAIDLDVRQQSLATALENRVATARCLDAPLPRPRFSALKTPSTAMLLQEIARLDSAARFIVIDAPGSDTPIGRRSLALADTIVTPVNASFLDLNHLGRFNPATLDLVGFGPFGELARAVRYEKAARGLSVPDWVLLKNRIRTSETRQQARVDRSLTNLAAALDARLATGLSERVGYRDLFMFGLTHADIARIPRLQQRSRTGPDDIARLLAELRLPPMSLGDGRVSPPHARVRAATRDRFLNSLRNHIEPSSRAVTGD